MKTNKSKGTFKVLKIIAPVLATIFLMASLSLGSCAGPEIPDAVPDEAGSVFFDKETGFSFTYPSGVLTVTSTRWIIPDGGDILLNIQKRKIDDIGEEETLGYDRQTALADMKELEDGNFGESIDFPFSGSEMVLDVDGIFLKEFIVFARFDVCDVTFERILIFYKDGYQFIINVQGNRDKIVDSMNEYFKVDTENCGDMLIWDTEKQEEFYKALRLGEPSEEAKEWYSSFNEIVSSISFSDDIGVLSDRNLIISQQQVHEDSDSENYEMLVAYPEFSGMLDQGSLNVINSDIVAIADNSIKEFRKNIKEMAEATSDTSEDTSEGSEVQANILQVDYSVSLYSEVILSSIFTEYFYTGGAHGGTNLITYNYDFKNNKKLELEDIFIDDFDYLNFLSEYSIEEIKKQQKNQDIEPDVSWIEEGAAPDIVNFSTFLLLEDALVIKFAEYQVAPYVAGSVTVKIPYTEFNDYINPESPVSDIINS